MASLWKLPAVFVCQNNRYCEHTKYSAATSVDQVAKRAAAYDMPGIHVDGNDPLAMYEAAHEAVTRARSGDGPTLIEAMTFRFEGHVVGDNDSYMDPGEKEGWMAKDPLPAYRAWLIAEGHATEDQLAKMEQDIEAEIDEALEFTLASPFPDADEIRKDVYGGEAVA